MADTKIDGEIIPPEDFQAAIAACCKNRDLDAAYADAPHKAKIYLGLLFYQIHFGEKANEKQVRQVMSEIKPELDASDIDYLATCPVLSEDERRNLLPEGAPLPPVSAKTVRMPPLRRPVMPPAIGIPAKEQQQQQQDPAPGQKTSVLRSPIAKASIAFLLAFIAASVAVAMWMEARKNEWMKICEEQKEDFSNKLAEKDSQISSAKATLESLRTAAGEERQRAKKKLDSLKDSAAEDRRRADEADARHANAVKALQLSHRAELDGLKTHYEKELKEALSYASSNASSGGPAPGVNPLVEYMLSNSGNVKPGGTLKPSGMSFTAFKEKQPSEPAVFKAKIRFGSGNHAYCDLLQNFDGPEKEAKNKFWAVRVLPMDRQAVDSGDGGLACFVTKNAADFGKEVVGLLDDGAYHVALVKLRFLSGRKFRQCCVMDEIEMWSAKAAEAFKDKVRNVDFSAAELRVAGSERRYVRGKIGVVMNIDPNVGVLTRPVLRVVMLTREKTRKNRYTVTDCIIEEPNAKTIDPFSANGNPGAAVARHTTTGVGGNGKSPSSPNRHRCVEEISASQSEVFSRNLATLSYVGIPLAAWQSDTGQSDGNGANDMTGYALLGEGAELFGYRVELWCDGACVKVHDTVNPHQRKELDIPDDWHVSFKHPEKFKYSAPVPQKDASN